MIFLVQSLVGQPHAQREEWLQKMKDYIPSIEIFRSVNGYNETETEDEFAQLGIPFVRMQHHNYGALACWITKYKCLKKQIEKKIPYLCFLEDDVALNETFAPAAIALEGRFADSKLNIIRLAQWGEGYITSLESSKRIISILDEKGVVNNIDNQLRCDCGKEEFFPIIHGLNSATNSGDVLKTNRLPDHFAFIAGKNAQKKTIGTIISESKTKQATKDIISK